MSKIANKKKVVAVDVVKDVLAWSVVTIIAFAYWIAVLLLISLFLLNIWHTTFDDILIYSIVLTVITSIGYAGVLCYRRFHG